MMKQNIDSLTLMYKFFLSGINPLTAKTFTELDVRQASAMAEHLEITVKEISACFSMSKMSNKDELGKYEHYKKLQMVEFCDFLVRLAFVKFKSSPGLSMLEKAEQLLDILLGLVGKRRIH